MLIFSVIRFLLKLSQTILILIVPTGLENTLNGFRYSFQKKTYGLNGFDTFFSHNASEFLVFVRTCCCFPSHKTFCDI